LQPCQPDRSPRAERSNLPPTSEALTRNVFTQPLEKLLRDGIADRTVRDLDPLETATLLFNLVGWTYIHMRTGPGWPPERARVAVLDIALNGVLREAARSGQVARRGS
jgi:hypothetical protein